MNNPFLDDFCPYCGEFVDVLEDGSCANCGERLHTDRDDYHKQKIETDEDF